MRELLINKIIDKADSSTDLCIDLGLDPDEILEAAIKEYLNTKNNGEILDLL